MRISDWSSDVCSSDLDEPALIWVSTEVEREIVHTRADLAREVNAAAWMLRRQGVGKGDRVLIYLPMIPEAAFFMLACARIGAIQIGRASCRERVCQYV